MKTVLVIDMQEDLSDAFLIMKKKKIQITIAGTKGGEILSELVRDTGESYIVKKRYSAFFDTRIDDLLKQLGTTELLLAGVNTHACIRMAAIDAYQRDFEVTIPIDCVASYDQEHHDITLKYLDGNIARLVQLDEILNQGAL